MPRHGMTIKNAKLFFIFPLSFCILIFDFSEARMCLAYPGKIESIKGEKAVVDFSGVKKEANISFVKVKKGDYVIVHAGFAIQKISDEEAMDAIEGFSNN